MLQDPDDLFDESEKMFGEMSSDLLLVLFIITLVLIFIYMDFLSQPKLRSLNDADKDVETTEEEKNLDRVCKELEKSQAERAELESRVEHLEDELSKQRLEENREKDAIIQELEKSQADRVELESRMEIAVEELQELKLEIYRKEQEIIQEIDKSVRDRIVLESRVEHLQKELEQLRLKDMRKESEKNQKQTIQISLMDLPANIHIRIFNYLDLRSRFRMRLVNKRMDKIQHDVKNHLESIKFTIDPNHYELELNPSIRRSPFKSRDVNQILHGLRRLALNTHVNHIGVWVDNSRLNEPQITHFLAALANFEADKLVAQLQQFGPWSLAQVNRPILLSFAKNITNVQLLCTSTSLTVQDLCALREAMFRDGSKLEHFFAHVNDEIKQPLAKEYFGVSIERDGFGRRIFRTPNESTELYTLQITPFISLLHFEGNLQTTIFYDHQCYVLLAKHKGRAKPFPWCKQIEMNYPYDW